MNFQLLLLVGVPAHRLESTILKIRLQQYRNKKITPKIHPGVAHCNNIFQFETEYTTCCYHIDYQEPGSWPLHYATFCLPAPCQQLAEITG